MLSGAGKRDVLVKHVWSCSDGQDPFQLDFGFLLVSLLTISVKNDQLRTHNFWIIFCLNWTQVLSKATRAVAVAAEKDPARPNRTRRA